MKNSSEVANTPSLSESPSHSGTIVNRMTIATTLLLATMTGCAERTPNPQSSDEHFAGERFNAEKSTMEAYDAAWTMAKELELERKMLVKQLDTTAPDTEEFLTLRSKIEEFNNTLERVYADSVRWFGGGRPDGIPMSIRFRSVPIIEAIDLPK